MHKGQSSEQHQDVMMADLKDDHALQILSFLPPPCAARTCATSKTGFLAVAARGEPYWLACAARTFGIEREAACLGPRSEDCGGSWHKAFGLWHGLARELGLHRAAEESGPEGAALPLPARWMLPWCQLKRWLEEHLPAAARTLRPGLRADVGPLLAENGMEDLKVHPLVLGIWQVCDGQDVPIVRDVAEMLEMRPLRQGQDWSLGVFGGYSVYDHEISTLLLPFRCALRLTVVLRRHLPALEGQATKLAFACSHSCEKVFFVDVNTGSVHIAGLRTRSWESAAPASGPRVTLHGLAARPELNGKRGTLVAFEESKGRWQVKMDADGTVLLLKPECLSPPPDGQGALQSAAPDGLLRWFEEYVRRLESGAYTAMPLQPERAPSTLGIRLFPSLAPELSSCVTQGVECTGSAIYMPEHQQGWTYSISFRLVGPASERGFQTCQLSRRVWIIEEEGAGGEPQRVQGEGVVGLFPILSDGGWELNKESDPHQQYGGRQGHMEGAFRYQSCSGRSRAMRGSFGGELEFVPGTRRNPTGAPFMARLAPFRLTIPDFVY